MKFLKTLPELESDFGNAEWKILLERMVDWIRSAIQSLPPEDRSSLREWVEQVEKVKMDSNLNAQEKAQKIEALDSGRVASQFLRALSNLAIEQMPLAQRGLWQMGLSIWAASARPEFAVFAHVAFQKVLPRFLLTPQGDNFLKATRDWIQDQPVEIR